MNDAELVATIRAEHLTLVPSKFSEQQWADRTGLSPLHALYRNDAPDQPWCLTCDLRATSCTYLQWAKRQDQHDRLPEGHT